MNKLEATAANVLVIAAFLLACLVLPFAALLAPVCYFVKQLVSPTKEQRPC